MIVGTAGHVDHGKTSLVRALTGVDTDRLKEEKARGMSIDLGFAYLPVEGGETIGFVDVPGHEKFVHTMVAGASGIDFVLLVVAADDGVMPQTKEHLAIIDLLGIEAGAVALSKADLVPPERLAEVEAAVRHELSGTALAGAPVIAVSAATGAGVDALRAHLIDAARGFARREASGRFRLAVDRSFTLSGAGTIVTGTVLSGSIGVGDHVVVSPRGLSARVRSIHAQNRPSEQGRAGDRCALNLTGDAITKDAIGRGDVVLDPDLHAPADRIDATLRVLAGDPKRLGHWFPVRLHHAAGRSRCPDRPLFGRSGDARAGSSCPARARPAGRGRRGRPLHPPRYLGKAYHRRRPVPRSARSRPQTPDRRTGGTARRSCARQTRPSTDRVAGGTAALSLISPFSPAIAP